MQTPQKNWPKQRQQNAGGQMTDDAMYTVAFLAWSHFSVHRDLDSLQLSLLFGLGLVLAVVLGTAFRTFILKIPAVDLNYYNRTRRTIKVVK
jgi:hypothetical protein